VGSRPVAGLKRIRYSRILCSSLLGPRPRMSGSPACPPRGVNLRYDDRPIPGEGASDVLAAAWYMVVFRVVHVLAAIAWGGSVFLFVMFIQPSVAAIAPAGAPFMAELLGKRKFVRVLIGLGSATVLGGLFLYWHDAQIYGGFSHWIGTAFGVSITIGAVAAIMALTIGIRLTRPNVNRLLQLGRQAAEAGGPTPE